MLRQVHLQTNCSTFVSPLLISHKQTPSRSSYTTISAPLYGAMNDYDGYLAVALEAAKAAGELILQAWDAPKNIEHKGAVDLVTETDKNCEILVLSHIRKAYPEHQFIGEEGSAAQGFTAELTDAPTWMCDPVDGTTNFVHRFPFSCVSIGLSIKKKVVVGVVYNPILNELFHSIAGRGAFLNDSKIIVSDTSCLSNAVVATELGTSREPEYLDACFKRMRNVGERIRSLRCCGSCALNLCGVAMGRLDAYYEVGLGGCWDLAAATLIVQEAGGNVLDPTGGPFNIMSRRVLGANDTAIAEDLASILAKGPWGPEEPPPLTL